MISIVSSGDSPDHGHPRAVFLGALRLAGRGAQPFVFSTEIEATFIDAGDAEAVATAGIEEPITFGELDFSTSQANAIARRRFKKILPAVATAGIEEPITFGELDFSTSQANAIARRRFKKILPGIINVRTDGQRLFAFRRATKLPMGVLWPDRAGALSHEWLNR